MSNSASCAPAIGAVSAPSLIASAESFLQSCGEQTDGRLVRRSDRQLSAKWQQRRGPRGPLHGDRSDRPARTFTMASLSLAVLVRALVTVRQS